VISAVASFTGQPQIASALLGSRQRRSPLPTLSPTCLSAPVSGGKGFKPAVARSYSACPGGLGGGNGSNRVRGGSSLSRIAFSRLMRGDNGSDGFDHVAEQTHKRGPLIDQEFNGKAHDAATQCFTANAFASTVASDVPAVRSCTSRCSQVFPEKFQHGCAMLRCAQRYRRGRPGLQSRP
jgi:hypothetical protein